jgi:hypothetical protein
MLFVAQKVTNKLRMNEQRGVFMFIQFSGCLLQKVGPPVFLMNAASRLMQLYPVVFKATQLLDRLVR